MSSAKKASDAEIVYVDSFSRCGGIRTLAIPSPGLTISGGSGCTDRNAAWPRFATSICARTLTLAIVVR